MLQGAGYRLGQLGRERKQYLHLLSPEAPGVQPANPEIPKLNMPLNSMLPHDAWG